MKHIFRVTSRSDDKANVNHALHCPCRPGHDEAFVDPNAEYILMEADLE
jgi:hypothetical protein